MTAFLYAFNEREAIYNIIERASGQRFHPSYTRDPGGLMADVTDDWSRPRPRLCQSVPCKALNDVSRLLNRNRIFIDRTKGIGVLTKEEAISKSCSGPVAR